MKSFLFNPINGICEPATYKEIQGYTGMSISAISKAKKNRTKIKSLNGLYIVDDNFTKEDLDKLRLSFFDPNEVWMQVENYPKYYVSNLGRVKSCYDKEVLLTPYLKQFKNLFVVLCNNSKRSEFYVHKLVAECFVKKVKGKNVVYHKDGNLRNNDCNNLEWISKNELGKKTGGLSKGIAVIKIDRKTGEELDHYDSMAEAGRKNFLHRETIRLAVSGKLATAAGFVWKVDKEFNKKRPRALKLIKRR